MRIQGSHLEAFVVHKSPEIPFELGHKVDMKGNLFNLKALADTNPIYIEDASSAPEWENCPALKMGLSSYLGTALRWPGGEYFGTLCILDKKPIGSTLMQLALLDSFRTSLEDELHLVLEINERKRYQRLLEGKMAELAAFNTELGKKEKRILDLKREMDKLHESASKPKGH